MSKGLPYRPCAEVRYATKVFSVLNLDTTVVAADAGGEPTAKIRTQSILFVSVVSCPRLPAPFVRLFLVFRRYPPSIYVIRMECSWKYSCCKVKLHCVQDIVRQNSLTAFTSFPNETFPVRALLEAAAAEASQPLRLYSSVVFYVPSAISPENGANGRVAP